MAEGLHPLIYEGDFLPARILQERLQYIEARVTVCGVRSLEEYGNDIALGNDVYSLRLLGKEPVVVTKRTRRNKDYCEAHGLPFHHFYVGTTQRLRPIPLARPKGGYDSEYQETADIQRHYTKVYCDSIEIILASFEIATQEVFVYLGERIQTTIVDNPNVPIPFAE